MISNTISLLFNTILYFSVVGITRKLNHSRVRSNRIQNFIICIAARRLVIRIMNWKMTMIVSFSFSNQLFQQIREKKEVNMCISFWNRILMVMVMKWNNKMKESNKLRRIIGSIILSYNIVWRLL